MLVPGRLKLREETSSVPELIYYDRSQSRSRAGRISSFIRIPVADPQGLLRRWPQTRESRVVVRKERWLYLYRNARIHLDAVKGLGTFIEFEVLLIEGKRQANRLLADLVEAFGIRKSDTIGGAYADLLQR